MGYLDIIDAPSKRLHDVAISIVSVINTMVRLSTTYKWNM